MYLMNVTSLQTSVQPLMTPLIANFLPIAVVLLGTYATFFWAKRLEDRKSRYELKQRVYFEVLDMLYSFTKMQERRDILKEQVDAAEKEGKDPDKDEDLRNQLLTVEKTYLELQSSILHSAAKIRIVGSKESAHAYFIFCHTILANKEFETLIDIQEEFVKSIRIDLMGERGLPWKEAPKKGWWRFW
jgi:hypothetical protein